MFRFSIAVIVVLFASISHAKLSIAYGGVNIDPRTGEGKDVYGMVQAQVTDFTYDLAEANHPTSELELYLTVNKDCFIVMNVVSPADVRLRGRYVFTSCYERNESAAKLRKMIESPMEFTLLVSPQWPVSFDMSRLPSVRMREAIVVLPNKAAVDFKGLNMWSIEAGRPTGLLDHVLNSFRRK